MKSGTFFALFSTHNFNGRAYAGANRKFVGPFSSKEKADEFVKRMQDKIQKVDVRVSQNMRQQQVYDEIFEPIAATTKPIDALSILSNYDKNQAETPATIVDAMHMLLVIATRWNGRRFAGETSILIGPFETVGAMEKWGEELTELPCDEASVFGMSIQLDTPEILKPTNLGPANITPELFAK